MKNLILNIILSNGQIIYQPSSCFTKEKCNAIILKNVQDYLKQQSFTQNKIISRRLNLPSTSVLSFFDILLNLDLKLGKSMWPSLIANLKCKY